MDNIVKQPVDDVQPTLERRYGFGAILSIMLNAGLVALIWGMLFAGSGRGFDFTDESFARMTYRQPEDITATPTLFNVIWKPIFDLSGGDIGASQRLGFIFLFITVLVASILTIRMLAQRNPFRANLTKNAWSAVDQINLVALSTGSVAAFYLGWRLLPTYHWITLACISWFWVGLLLWLEGEQPSRSMLGAALIGFTAALIFWAKPTAAALLPLFVLAGFAFNRGEIRRLVAPMTVLWGIVGFVAGMSLPFIQGETPASIVDKYQLGLEYQRLLKPDEYGGLLFFIMVSFLKLFAVILALGLSLFKSAFIWGIVLLVALTSLRTGRRLQWTQATQHRLIEWILTAGWIVTMAWLIKETRYVGILILSGLMLATLFLLVSTRATNRIERHATYKPFSGLKWLFPFFALLVTHVFGSIDAYLTQMNQATVFLLLAVSVPVLRYANPYNRLLRSVIVTTLLIVVFYVIARGSMFPYRQYATIWNINTEITLDSGETLVVSADMARYINTYLTLGETNDFETDTPIIDLTGHSPGVVYVLDGRAPVFPWILGGYTGSDEAAEYLLSLWEEDALRQAWVLTAEQNAEREMDEVAILTAVGLNFPADYVKVGEVKHFHFDEVQALWRPR